ncbi:MAG TPA: hypothetical protein VJY42_02585 [Candidatus Methanomethylophilaceae archaeon]|nr:hypothetical protein [Candidatus Methanomethylophilaceae archaeon]
MNYRPLELGAAMVSAVAHVSSIAVVLISLQTTPILPMNFGNLDYLALLIWIAFAIMSTACFVAVMWEIIKVDRMISKLESVECYQLKTKGLFRGWGKHPKVKKTGGRTQ